MFYRSYKKLSSKYFLEELVYELFYSNFSDDYTVFDNIFSYVLNKHAPLKEKLVEGNNKTYVSKTYQTYQEPVLKTSQINLVLLKMFFDLDGNETNFVVALNKKEKIVV